MNLLAVSLLSGLAGLALCLAEDTCGGTYRGFQYTITTPNYPNNYPSRTECVYRLQAEPTLGCEQQFHLQFLDFNLKASETCKGDYLQVGDNNIYCGNTLGLRKFKGKNNTLILSFHSDEKDTAKGFKILVSALPCHLKLDPLTNPSFKGFSADGRSIESTAYRRGIRGGNEAKVNNSATRLNLLANDANSSIRRPQIDAAASAANPIIDNNTNNNNNGGPRVTSYLFLPPRQTNANVTLHYDLGSAITDKGFNDVTISSFAKDANVMDKKIGAPALGVVDYEVPQLGSDCDKQLPTGGSSDRINYDPIQVGAGQGSSPNLVYDPRYGFVGAGYYPPNTGYPGGFGFNYPNGAYEPNGGYPSYPSYEPINPNYPNDNPALGGASGFIGAAGGECCRVPSTTRFSIVSPGFPGEFAANNGYSCRYNIVKSSPQVCRLRLNFRFFNFGADDPYCSQGYVDIDGQRFCGCRTGQSLQLLFTDYIAKTISVFSAANSRSRLSGFLIDVVQEPCIQPAYIQPGYSTGIQRRSVNAPTIVPSPLDPNPLIRNKRYSYLGYSYPKPNIPLQLSQDVGFIPSAVAQGQTQERFFTGNCQSRVLFDWAVAWKEALFKNARCASGFQLPGFNTRLTRSYLSLDDKDEVTAEPTDCEEINENQGEIKSPLYPNTYPNSVKKCYRFNKAPNVCKLEVYVRDFDLESSQDCAKDYLSFSFQRKKYCGRSLNDFRTVFDLTQTSSVQVDFVSDERGTGRGFDIGFSQLPCELTAKF